MKIVEGYKKMNLANQITIARICLIPIFVIVAMLTNSIAGDILATLVFAIAAFTDFLDGHIARSRNLVTTFGKFLDPLADKLLTTSAFIILVADGRVVAWIVILILAREFAITGLRTIAVSEGVVIAASSGGKIKTVLQMVSIILLLLAGSGTMFVIGQVCLYLALIATLYSGWEYLVGCKDMLIKGGM